MSAAIFLDHICPLMVIFFSVCLCTSRYLTDGYLPQQQRASTPDIWHPPTTTTIELVIQHLAYCWNSCSWFRTLIIRKIYRTPDVLMRKDVLKRFGGGSALFAVAQGRRSRICTRYSKSVSLALRMRSSSTIFCAYALCLIAMR